MGIDSDQIASAIGISLMLLFLVHRTIIREMPQRRLVWVALVCVGVAVVVTMLVWMSLTH